MNKKRLFYGLLFCAFVGFPLNAATVSFLVIETGLPERAAVNRYTVNWEDGLMDVFFEQGHIVSNAPIMRLSEKPAEIFPDEAEGEFAAALEGGIEFFIIALVDYPPSAGRETVRPQNVSLRLFKTIPRTLLHEQLYTDNTPGSARDEYNNLKKAVLGLVAHLNGR